MRCSRCGAENRPSARFCQNCGAALEASSRIRSSRQPTKPLLPTSSHAQTADVPTRPLPAPVAFAPLPEGALLKEGQYAVSEVRAAGEQMNEYLVEETQPVRLCPQCRAEVRSPDERFCVACGADLSDAAPVLLRYRVRESAHERAFVVPALLLQAGVDHPGLFLPREVFTEAPYGPPRAYAVETEHLPVLAASLPVPQESLRVLEWGITLARALEHLHRQGITLGEMDLGRIGVEGDRAFWLSLENAQVLSAAEQSRATAYFARDLAGMAALLLYLATGRAWDLRRPGPFPPELEVLVRVLANPGALTAGQVAAMLEERLAQMRRPAHVTLTLGCRTDVGMERTLNEDSLLALQTVMAFRSRGIPVALAAIADGMGGHEAGDVASQIVIRTLAQRVGGEILAPHAAGQPLPTPREWLSAVIQQANWTIYNQRRVAGTDMGTTLVVALMLGDAATIANIGDSRAYHLRPDGIEQITVDHSLVERLVATGQITREEAATHPQKNVIYRTLGDKPRVEADFFERRLAPGEALLLCSDGLSGMVPDEHIWHIWRTSTSPQEACDRLVEAANSAGGEDNISVIVVQVGR
ncbi:MAG: Stp1/IreP family PP2C-type Ser/Thr phosphatase [Anaerolineae bacterium]|nr:Stp1/IreP family PP2C-type Ser/Thr phosphatase [Anaerolineae bacterium]